MTKWLLIFIALTTLVAGCSAPIKVQEQVRADFAGNQSCIDLFLNDDAGGTYQTFAQDIDKAAFAVGRYLSGEVAVCAWGGAKPWQSWGDAETVVIEQCERVRLSHMSQHEREVAPCEIYARNNEILPGR